MIAPNAGIHPPAHATLMRGKLSGSVHAVVSRAVRCNLLRKLVGKITIDNLL